MAFIDVDEFLVVKDATMASLPKLLSEYTDYGALAANWQVGTVPVLKVLVVMADNGSCCVARIKASVQHRCEGDPATSNDVDQATRQACAVEP